MKISGRVFFGGLAIAALFTIIVAAFGAWQLISLLSVDPTHTPESTETRNLMPESIREPRILTAADYFTKNDFYKLKNLTPLQVFWRSMWTQDERRREQEISSEIRKGKFRFGDLKVGEFDGQTGLDVVIAGNFGAQFLDDAGALKREIKFEPSELKVKFGWYEQKTFAFLFDNFQIFDLENDGKAEFAAHGYTQGATIFNFDGNALTRYGDSVNSVDAGKIISESELPELDENKAYIEALAIFDVDGNGKKDFLVSEIGRGLTLLDDGMRQKWNFPNEYPGKRLSAHDLNGDGKIEIVEIDETRRILTANGQLQNEIVTETDREQMLISPAGKLQFVEFVDHKIRVTENKLIFEAETPMSEVGTENYGGLIAYPKMAWIRLHKGQPEVLAVVGDFVMFDRSMFYLYDGAGKLLYHELLPENCGTLAALPRTDGGADILIGGSKTIWRYSKN